VSALQLLSHRQSSTSSCLVPVLEYVSGFRRIMDVRRPATGAIRPGGMADARPGVAFGGAFGSARTRPQATVAVSVIVDYANPGRAQGGKRRPRSDRQCHLRLSGARCQR
nr:hypothetical protein [Tanacetum cinerariifolium]